MGIRKRLVDMVWSLTGRGVFVDRPPMNLDEIYARYYVDSGLDREAVVRCFRFLATELALPTSRLRPTDRFDEELAPVINSYDSGYNLVLWTLEKEARNRGVQLSRIETIDDYIRAWLSVSGESAGMR